MFWVLCKSYIAAVRGTLISWGVLKRTGNVAVNKDISTTLQSTDENIDFWWLNNGITIIASHATIHGYSITLDNVYVELFYYH